MLTIGLTGGVASGKSSVATQFAALGVPIIDTDLIARELVAPMSHAGQAVLRDIAAHFGAQALHADGQLNRAWLRQRIFSDTHDRAALNAIMHPRIRARVEDELTQLDTPYAIVVIPLLIESQNYDDIVQQVLVVDLDEAEQLHRLMARDGIDATQARAMLSAQATRAQRLARADDVIDNSSPPDALAPQIRRLHTHYSELALATRKYRT
jgi:dephospho-CoA kinase